MFVKQYGRGEQAFFALHGWNGDHRTFEPITRFVPEDARLYSADLPGCGRSPAPEYWDLKTVTHEVVRALEQTGARRVTLVGNCIGALLGMCAALETPIVERLVLIDAFAMWPWYFRVFTAPVWGEKAYTCTFANPIGRWITNKALAAKRSQGSDLTHGFAGAQHAAQLKYLHVMREIESARHFVDLNLPVDVIFGSRTFAAVRQSAAMWQEFWPHARIWELENTGHLVVSEAPGEVSNIVFGGGECSGTSVHMSNSTRG